MQSDRTRIRRHAERARQDRDLLYAILDEASVCHVGFTAAHGPVVIPMMHARVDDRLYLHGSPATGTVRELGDGAPACVAVTLLDGLVVSRSAFGHAVNYRSAVLFGSFAPVQDTAEQEAVARAVVERVIPGRWAETRHPTPQEYKQTAFIGMDIVEASVKMREGFPLDGEEDRQGDRWAGHVPLVMRALEPVPDEDIPPEARIPSSIRRLSAP